MLGYLLRRVFYAIPIMIGVAFVCFVLVHLAPGDPLVSILPPDASVELQAQLRELYGFNRSLPEQFGLWVWRALHGDLGVSIASNRPVASEVMTAVGNTLRLAVVATFIGFVLGSLFGFVAGYFRNSWVDHLASVLSVMGVSVPHYWLGMVMVIVFSSQLAWLPGTGAGPSGSGDWAWDWEHLQFLVLPAITMSVIPMGIIARTVRATMPIGITDMVTAGSTRNCRCTQSQAQSPEPDGPAPVPGSQPSCEEKIITITMPSQ